MTLSPHKCLITGDGPPFITCVCTTGRDHGENEMDMPGEQLATHRAGVLAKIEGSAEDLARDFAHDDRKDDEDLTRGDLELAFRLGVVTVDQVVASFRATLARQVDRLPAGIA